MPLLSTRELIDKYHNQRDVLVEEAIEADMPFSVYLDAQYDPEKDDELGSDDVRLSAMEVIEEDLGISYECNPAAGIWPTKCEDVIGSPEKEFALKQKLIETYRSVAYLPQMRNEARLQQRRDRWERAGTFQSIHDTAPGSTLTPYFDAMAHWDEDVQVDIPLEELTSRMADTSKTDYRSTILKYDENAFREERRSAAADPPMASFDTSERPIQLKKRMLAIPFTYEHLREVEFVDKAAEHVEQLAVQRTIAKVDEGLEAAVKGAPTSTSKDVTAVKIIKLVDLDAAATNNKFTPEAWLNLQKKFKRGYMLTSVIGYEQDITNLQLARIANTNVMMVQLNERQNAEMSGFGGSYRVMNQLSQGVALGWHDYFEDLVRVGTASNAPTHNAMLVYDMRKLLEFVTQMNTDLIENTRDMLKQVEYIVCSEIWGWITYQAIAGYLVDLEASDSDTNLNIAK